MRNTPTPTPRQLITWCTRTVTVTTPLALVVLVLWGMRWWPEGRPFLALMVFMLLLLLSVASAACALLAGCHLAIHQAFQAGLRTGQAAMDFEPRDLAAAATRKPRPHRRDALLELVE